MNKKKFTALIAVLSMMALTACNNTKETANMSEVESYDESSTDLLVSTLQYLLNDGEETENEVQENVKKENEEKDNEEKDNEIKKEEVTNKDTEIHQTDNGESNQSQEEEILNQIEATIYYGNGASDKLSSEVAAMEELTAENLISELAGHNIVPLGTKVNSFEEEEGDSGRVLHLDLDKAFREYLKTMTSESESIILASITITFLEAYDARNISITVDGKILETNHATYEEPFKIAQDYIDIPSQSN